MNRVPFLFSQFVASLNTSAPPFSGRGQMKKAQFESMSEKLIERTMGPCEKCVKDAGIKKSDLDEVILVGGMTRMPKVQEKAKTFFGMEPSRGKRFSPLRPHAAIAPPLQNIARKLKAPFGFAWASCDSVCLQG